MCTELENLEDNGAWNVDYCEDDKNVIIFTWGCKLKQYHDGLIKKLKARFCDYGDMQTEGIYFFETYAPVVKWTTMCLI